MSRRALLLALLIAAVVVAGGLRAWGDRRESERRLEFVVPPGTVARLAAGEQIEVLPPQIDLALDGQDTLVIRNDDSQPVQVGPLLIAPGQRFEQRYYNAGTYELICTLHESQRLRVVVAPRGG